MFKNLCLIIHLVLLMPEALISFIFTSLNFKKSHTNVVNMHKLMLCLTFSVFNKIFYTYT